MSEAPVERFQCAPGMRLQAHERVTAIHLQNLDKRLDRIEQMMERLERRLWLAVYGVAAVVLAKAVQTYLEVVPLG
ncbi:GTA head formation protein, RCAP_rcc01685 family [Sulfitobacter sp.]|uniref:GTA head formation protein, RCAP_rcc01685 family n=1 Tax=Sulfitobacter sp. TaxID=1903071 RepID=UPI003022E89C